MIKFFREIRRNLLSEGKTGKYLKYALGEIILVMIGILLALQVNNWNEHRKEKEQLRELATILFTDVKNKISENRGDRNFGERILYESDTLITVWENTNRIDTTYLKSVLSAMGADYGHTSGFSPVNQTLSNSDLWKELPDTLVSGFDIFYKGSIEASKVSFQNYSKYAYEHKINFLMPNDLINLNRPISEILKRLDGQEKDFIRRLRLTVHGITVLNNRFSDVIANGENTIKMLEEFLRIEEN